MIRSYRAIAVLGFLLFGLVSFGYAQNKGIKEFEKEVEEKMEKRLVEEVRKKADDRAPTPGIMILCEFIEVEMKDFSDWVLENPILTDATPLRKATQGWVDAGKAKIVETLVVSARSGQRAKVEAVEEYIYPTEFDAPKGVAVETDDENVAVIPPNGSAFETRNVGATLEVDPVLGEDGTVDLNLAPEIVMAGEEVEIVSRVGDNEMAVNVPRFHATKVTTQISLYSGDYGFLGTSRLGITRLPDADDPIILMFVRCDVSGGN